jgi:tetratricopeptide (TPR) repeat protein
MREESMHGTKLVAILVVLGLALGACGNKDDAKKAEEKKVEKKAEPKAEEPKAEEPEAGKASAPEAPPAAEEPEAGKASAPEAPPTAEEPEAGKASAPEAPPTAEAGKASGPEAPPTAEEPKAEVPAAAETGKPSIEDRRKRVQEIYRLGRSDQAGDLEKLRTIILDEALPGYERATAIRALGTKARPEMVETLKTLMESKDLAISSEAAIMLFQWGEKVLATPKLRELQKMGIALRRAFFKGLKDGNYEYAPEAEEFFKSALEAPQAHVRLDAALGLLHLGQTETALEHFKKALSTEEKAYVRLTAVSYLASARKAPEVQALLEEAAEDKDPKVAARAKQILTAGKQPEVKPAEVPKVAAPVPAATDEKPAEAPAK